MNDTHQDDDAVSIASTVEYDTDTIDTTLYFISRWNIRIAGG